MKNIILPTDFSDNARHALLYAYKLFDSKDSHFYLVNTYEPPKPTGMLIKIDDIVKDDALAGLKNELNILKRDLPDATGTIKSIAHLGELNESLNLVAQAKKGEIIVMGTKGATGLKEIFIGSNAAEVIESSQYPVLAVPDGAKLEVPKKIVFAADYENLKNLSALEPLKKIAELTGAEIIIVNVNTDDNGEIKFNPVIEKLAVDKFLEDIKHSYHEIDNEDVIDGLNDFLATQNADMLAMIPERLNFVGRMFHRSVTKRMVLHTQIPLLALRE